MSNEPWNLRARDGNEPQRSPSCEQDEQLAWVDQHVLTFKDAAVAWDGSWSNDASFVDDGVGLADGVVSLTSFCRAAGSTPIIVERWPAAPPDDDLDDYDLVVEATLAVPSGELSIENESGEQGKVRIPPGTYRVRAHYANEDSCTYDGDDGANHVRVSLFPEAAAPHVQLRKKELGDTPVRTYIGKRSEVELISMLEGGNISHGCLAAVALVRLAKLAPLRERAGHVPLSVRRVLASVAWLAGAAAIPLLQSMTESSDEDVRERAEQSLARLKEEEDQ
jgi:hypothetical protein